MTLRPTSSPYKFLDSYGTRDTARFFARALETDVLLADIIVSRLVVLFAKTGTGKTSLINAGVRPRLRERGFRTFLVRIREDPFESTRTQLNQQLTRDLPDGETLGQQLRLLAAQVKRPMVLFFDQFEEFFLYAVQSDVTRSQEFVDMVADLYEDVDSGIHIVFSMREEWFVDMGIFRQRIPAIFHNDSNLRLRWFTAAQARDAIVLPAGLNAYEPALVDILVEELTGTSQAVAPVPSVGEVEPAQLQIVCDTLWRRTRERPISIAHYRELAKWPSKDSTAQQVLDSRLVQQFARLGREELDILGGLLPELRTAEGTKRVREVDDLYTSLAVTGATPVDPIQLRQLLERLRRQGLIDIVPREAGQIVELTHDYLAARLDEMQHQIALIWPRQALQAGLKAFRARRELLRSDVVTDVVAAAPGLSLSIVEGELVLRSALSHLVEVSSALPALVGSGAPVWRIFKQRIEQGAEAERVHAIQTLIEADSDEAYAVLEHALTDSVTAEVILRLLARATTTRAVDLLSVAAEMPDRRRQARNALAELASAPGHSDVGARAQHELRQSFAHALSTPSLAPQALADMARLDAPFAVTLLREVMHRTNLAEAVRDALVSLTSSTDPLVAAQARQALLDQVGMIIKKGSTEAWVVEALHDIATPSAVQMLGELLSQTVVRDAAMDALRSLRVSSERADVAQAAARQLEEPEPWSAGTSAHPPAAGTQPRELPQGSVLLDSHLDLVLRLLATGRMVPLLGKRSRAVDAPARTMSDIGVPLPSNGDFVRDLAALSGYPPDEPMDLTRVTTFFAAVLGRPALDEALSEVFGYPSEPTQLDRLLARLVLSSRGRQRHDQTRVLLTTAFDDRLEQAFIEQGVSVDVLSFTWHQGDGLFTHRAAGDPSPARPLARGRAIDMGPIVIARLHGGFETTDPKMTTFVVTEEDLSWYSRFLGDRRDFLPIEIERTLKSAGALLLGADLRDRDLQQLFSGLFQSTRVKRGQLAHSAVAYAPTRVDVEIWASRDVQVVDASLDEYTERLARFLDEFNVDAVPE